MRQHTSSLPPSHEAQHISRKGERHDHAFPRSDETCPEHEHHPMIIAALVAFPVMILVSLVGSLFGMA